MNKLYGFMAACCMSLFLLGTQAQNVGIGTTTPVEKLDVKGNLNVQGSIKINGNAGQPGQVLTSGANGVTEWAPVNATGGGTYKNMVRFAAGQQYAWTVPAGVTSIRFEGWTGGGGGKTETNLPYKSVYASGAGGSYLQGVIPVTPGQQIVVTVPKGGQYLTPMQLLRIKYGADYIEVMNPAEHLASQQPTLVGTLFQGTQFISGEHGSFSDFEYAEVNNVKYSVARHPNGGKAANGGFGARGGKYQTFLQEPYSTVYTDVGAWAPPGFPGGGGTVGVKFDGTKINIDFVPGADGVVYIYY